MTRDDRAVRDRALRLMVVSTGLGTGGAEMMLYKLACALPGGEFDLRVLSLRDRGTIGSRLEGLSIPVHTLNLQHPLPVLAGVPRAVRLCQAFRPDVLLGWMYHGNLFASLLWHLTRRQAGLIWSVRQTLYDLTDEPRLTRAVIRAGIPASRSPAAIIYNSQVAARQHGDLGYDATHAVVVPNGFDVARFRPRPEARAILREQLGVEAGTAVIGHLARYHPMKDHATFLQAAASMVGHSGVHFVCAGRGVDANNHELTQQIERLNLAGRVHLLGEISDVAGLLPGLDCLCSSSVRGEGFPNVLGEAMACGVPCVVTDVGDCGYIVGDSGVVVAPVQPLLLGAALTRLLNEPADARRARSGRARARVLEAFDLPAVTAQYGALFRKVSHPLPKRRQDAHG